MKNLNLLAILIVFIFLLSFSNGSAQEYTRWHLPEGAIARYGKGRTSRLTYFPDGTRLAVTSSIGTWIYDVGTGEAIELLTGDMWRFARMAFSPDGKTSAVASGSHIRLFDPHTRDMRDVLAGHTLSVYSLAFSPTGEGLASGSRDTTVRLWDVQTGELLRTLIGHTDGVMSVVYSPDGKTLVSFGRGEDNAICIWNVQNRRAPANDYRTSG